MECVICKKKISIFSKKLADGCICKKCTAVLPKKLISKKWHSYDIKAVEKLIRNRKIEPTNHLGTLAIDSFHYLLSFDNLIFNIDNLRDIEISVTNVRQWEDKVYCDISFFVSLKDINFNYRTVIKSKVICPVERVDNEHIRWSEPRELIVFRQLLNQMISNKYEAYHNQLKEMSPDYELMYEKAKALFLTDDNYDLEYIKKIRKRLIKAFHPDNFNEIDSEFVDTINDSYNILKGRYSDERKDL